MMLRVAVLGAAASTAWALGPYKPVKKSFTYSALDSTNQNIDVVYPQAAAGEQFPLISYAHGFSDGGTNVMGHYERLFDDMVSYGYVIAAPRACNVGCLQGCKSNSGDPPCFGNYYKEQLKVLDWARTTAAAGLPINASAGVGIAGHSMGGQATVFSAAYANASQYGIKAAVMHHAFTHIYPPPLVPFLAFTGTKDTTAPPSMADGFFNAQGACPTRALVNKVGATHCEPAGVPVKPGDLGCSPSNQYNPKMADYSVAWFKVFLDETPKAFGVDFDAMIFGKGSDGMCSGGDGDMNECTALRG